MSHIYRRYSGHTYIYYLRLIIGNGSRHLISLLSLWAASYLTLFNHQITSSKKHKANIFCLSLITFSVDHICGKNSIIGNLVIHQKASFSWFSHPLAFSHWIITPPQSHLHPTTPTHTGHHHPTNPHSTFQHPTHTHTSFPPFPHFLAFPLEGLI